MASCSLCPPGLARLLAGRRTELKGIAEALRNNSQAVLWFVSRRVSQGADLDVLDMGRNLFICGRQPSSMGYGRWRSKAMLRIEVEEVPRGDGVRFVEPR